MRIWRQHCCTILKCFILIEPTIGLDVVVKDKIRQAIREINQKYNTTVILTTHDLNDIEELCQRIIIIDAGKKIYDATLDQLKQDYGDNCSVIFEWKQSPDPQQIEKLQSLSGQFVVHKRENGIQIYFSKKECTVAEIIAKVMGIAEIKDVQIKETELTDIVKKIYQGSEGRVV